MIMRNYRETYIRRAEIAQLIILHQLYLQRDSQGLVFQGGTAIRWCYGGSRFSEDLDFVTSLPREAVQGILAKALKGMQKTMVPHFGVGEMTLIEKAGREDALKFYADFRPENSREKISIKIELERLAADKRPDLQHHVLSSLPSVAYLVSAGEFRVPRPNVVMVAETPAEILSDKVRSLLERPYIKGRDLFDVWFLSTILKAAVDREMMERKFSLYRAPFQARRDMVYFIRPSEENRKEMAAAIENDLSRFLPPEVMTVHRQDGFAALLSAVRLLLEDLQSRGMGLL
jgi:predicted nucleotidyltransferase component of viral defense system